jgi:hypothetical protein
VEVMDTRTGKRIFLYTSLLTIDELEYHDSMALLCVKCPKSEFAPLGNWIFSGDDGSGVVWVFWALFRVTNAL